MITLKPANFSEVRCDYFDEASNWWCVDAWRTDDNNEEGVVVAHINPDTFEVDYVLPWYKEDSLIHETIKEKLKEIINN